MGSIFTRLLFFLAFFVFYAGCGEQQSKVPAEVSSGEEVASPSEEVSETEIVSAHTYGIISRKDAVRIRFVSDVVSQEKIGKPLESSPFVFEPALEGEAKWTGSRELMFQPAADMVPGQKYSVQVGLEGISSDWKGEEATFSFEVLRQSYWYVLEGLEADDAAGKIQKFTATVQTADFAEEAEVEKLVSARHGTDALRFAWTHDSKSKSHRFVVHGLQRGLNDTQLILEFDGKPLGVDKKSIERAPLPALDMFKLLSARAVTEGERYIELRFSDPLESGQNLQGLVTVDSRSDLRFTVSGSILRIYSGQPWLGVANVGLSSISNASGEKLESSKSAQVSFEPIGPEVRFSGNGVIFPTTQNLVVPIETVNLRSITVEALQVFESNIPQFLQVNDFSGTNQLHRVGRVVWKQAVPIEQTADRNNRWIHLGLDVSDLVSSNPNGLFQLKLSFDRGDIVYPCDTEVLPSTEVGEDLIEEWDVAETESSSWDNWEEDYWDAYESRFNPCHSAYYQSYGDHNVVTSRNVMISDIAVLAKQGQDRTISTVVTDLRTAKPLSEAKVMVLDYQLQEIASATSDENGMAALEIDRKAFAVVAKSAEGQSSWLKLDGGSSLSLSHFDVSGASIEKGIKGFFYGERGVWRPGDDIHLNFVRMDSASKLPAEHPLHFELYNPRGQLVESRVVLEENDGFYSLKTRTDENAITGNYLAKVKVGGAKFEKELRIETVVPNRLKIELDFGTDRIDGDEPQIESTLRSRWLHGAIAKGLKSTIDVRLLPQKTAFPKYNDYIFDDLVTSMETETEELFEGTLDENGEVRVEESIVLPESTPGLLKATFRTRVFEKSGAFSVDQHSITLSPHDRYIGIKTPRGDVARGMLLTDVKHTVDIVGVDSNGELSGDGEVEVRLYKINWRWWWEKGQENLGDYVGSNSHDVVAQGRTELKKGKGEWEFEVKYPDWGRYLLVASDASGTHRATKVLYIDWPGWAGRAQGDNPGGASVLSVNTENKKVDVGEEISINIPTSMGGRALVSIENGTEVLQSDWVEPQGETTVHRFLATPEMAPSVYAHVTLLQPHTASGNDLPIRLYGIVPIEVVDPSTVLEPVIESKDTFQPESAATVSVSEKAGRAMTYTLAVVDEGLLGLTRFQTPDAWSSFYRREALGVRTWDNYDSVAGAYGSALEGMIAIGGDGDGGGGPQAKANRFPPMVEFLGPFKLAAGASASHKVDIPQYIGEVRVMVVAGDGEAYGNADKAVKVKKPLMVLATLPRVVGPKEEVSLPVSVFALEENIKDVELTVEVEGGVEVVGGSKRQLVFGEPGDKMGSFRLKVGEGIGIAKIKVRAKGNGESAEQDIEIDIRHPGSEVVTSLGGIAAASNSWGTSVSYVGVAGTNSATLEVSRLPPMDLTSRMDSLIRYPHGCIEQTTSSVFPQVLLSSLMELSPERTAEVQRNIQSGINRIRRFQNGFGGFSYWPGENATSDWGSTYAGHFLIEAERAGYVLPAGMRSKWLAYQKQMANRWVPSGSASALEQSYRLYTLALAGAPEIGAMNRLKENSLENTAAWRLAAAYHLAGQPEVAKAMAKGLSVEVADYTELSGTFGTALRDKAMILETLALIGEMEGASVLAEIISTALSSGEGMSTQTTAYGLVSMARYASQADNTGAVSFSWDIDGKKETMRSEKPLVSIPLALSLGKASKLKVDNPGQSPLYTRVILSGLPPIGEEQRESSKLELNVAYMSVGDDPKSLDPAAIGHGEDFVAVISVTNPNDFKLDELALSHIVPSGWEIHGEASGTGSGYEYRDVRDDRIYTYFDLAPKGSVQFSIDLNASYQGSFYLPPVSVETMYDASIYAREKGQWVEISDVRPKG
jgi:alpha-2-macroglobulin